MSEIDMLTRYHVASEHLDDIVLDIHDAYVEALAALEAVEAENEQLRNVIGLCGEYVSDDRCEGCVVKHACYNGDIDDCPMRVRLINMMGELEGRRR